MSNDLFKMPLCVLSILLLSSCINKKGVTEHGASKLTECATFGAINFEMASAPPQKVRVTWNDSSLNECTGELINKGAGYLTVHREEDNTLVVSEGGIGYTSPPQVLNLEIYDMNNCAGGELRIFDMVDFQPEIADHFETPCRGFNHSFQQGF